MIKETCKQILYAAMVDSPPPFFDGLFWAWEIWTIAQVYDDIIKRTVGESDQLMRKPFLLESLSVEWKSGCSNDLTLNNANGAARFV